MSRYDWEAGSLKLPTAAWVAFKRSLQNGVKKMYANDFELAVILHGELARRHKGLSGYELSVAFAAELNRTNRILGQRGPETRPSYDFEILERDEVECLVLGRARQPVLRKPQKKDVPVVNARTLTFSEDEMRIKLDNASRTVHYHSGDNNHQVERARSTMTAQLFFELLSKVQWTRGTGGKLMGDDEYNRKSRGATYVTARYGPLGKDVKAPSTKTQARPSATAVSASKL